MSSSIGAERANDEGVRIEVGEELWRVTPVFGEDGEQLLRNSVVRGVRRLVLASVDSRTHTRDDVRELELRHFPE